MKKLILLAIILCTTCVISKAGNQVSLTKVLSKTFGDTIKKKEVINKTFNSPYLDLAQLRFTAKDSVITDPENNIQEFFGDAIVNYGQIKITANYIKIDRAAHILYANDTKNTATFVYKNLSDNSTNTITASSLVFDLNTKKGDFFNAVSQSAYN